MARQALWVFPFVIALAGIGGCGNDDEGDGNMAGTGSAAGEGGESGASGEGGESGASGEGGESGASGEGGEGGEGGESGEGGQGGQGGDGGMPDGDCEGFPLEGLMHSPGGDVLPNTCMPFHPTTNNPYAVRCVDAWPWYDSGFPGDEFCILPPPPDKGLQYGVHPQGKDWYAQVSTGDMSGYENVADEFLLDAGGEEQLNYQTGTANEAEMKYYRNYARMRQGSHHMIVSTEDPSTPQEMWGPASTAGLTQGVSLPGAQRPDENTPKSLAKPDEDVGYYSVLPAETGVTFNMHHFNATEGVILKEAWTNIWFEEEGTIRLHGIFGLDIAQAITLNIPVGQTRDLHYAFNITQPVRIVTAFGHRHAWTTNFSSWIVKEGGENEILYQSFNWYDEPTYRYDSLTDNPVPSPETLADGALSGIRTLMPGEQLHFNCRIQYTDERAAAVGAPMPAEIGALRFANEAFTAEMCILFGSTAAVQLPRPTPNNTPLPDFATMQ